MSTLSRCVRRTTALLLLFCLVVPSLRAEEAGKSSQARIVLVGISDYADKQIKPRKHAEADARALYDLFVSKDHLGADPKNVRLLLGTMANLGYDAEKIRLVLNRSTAITGINVRNVETALERPISHEVVNDYQRAISALNSGQPFAYTKPDSRLSRSVLDFARSIDSLSTAPTAVVAPAARAAPARK